MTVDLTAAVAPLVDVAHGLIEAAETMSGTGSPMADSPAMAELAAEAMLMSDRWVDPVVASLSLSGLHRFAAGDHLRQFMRMFGSQPVPVYAHLPVARAMLDTAAHGFWLSESGIGAERRVQRYTILRLVSGLELKRAPKDTGNREKGKAIIDDIKAESNDRGWVFHKKKGPDDAHRIGTQSLPSARELIAALLAGDDRGPGSDVHADIANVMWWYLSGVTHGATFALLNSVDGTAAAASTNPLVQPKAAIFTSSAAVINYGLILMDGYENQVDRYARLFGNASTDWEQAKARAMGFRQARYEAMGNQPNQ